MALQNILSEDVTAWVEAVSPSAPLFAISERTWLTLTL